MECTTYKVYRLTCDETGKMYIGVTKKTIDRRMSGHFYIFRKNVEQGLKLNKLQKAFKKHGIEYWTVDILKDGLTKEEGIAEEIAQIAKHKSFGRNGYNATSGGIGQNNVVWTESSKLKLSNSLKKTWKENPQKVSLETRKLQSEVKRNNHFRAVKIIFRGIEYLSLRDAERQTGITLHKIKAEMADPEYQYYPERTQNRKPNPYTTKDGTFASRKLAAEHYDVSIHNLAGYLKRNGLKE